MQSEPGHFSVVGPLRKEEIFSLPFLEYGFFNYIIASVKFIVCIRVAYILTKLEESMTDSSNANNEVKTPEYVAFLLMREVMGSEAKPLNRKELLVLYSQCLAAVKNPFGLLTGDYNAYFPNP
jgi:hypothetical protein